VSPLSTFLRSLLFFEAFEVSIPPCTFLKGKEALGDVMSLVVRK